MTVTPYLRTEWGVQWLIEPRDKPLYMPSALIAREYAANYNALCPHDPVKVVQRTISDWGDDE